MQQIDHGDSVEQATHAELFAVIRELLAQVAVLEADNARLKAENVAIKAESAPKVDNAAVNAKNDSLRVQRMDHGYSPEQATHAELSAVICALLAQVAVLEAENARLKAENVALRAQGAPKVENAAVNARNDSLHMQRMDHADPLERATHDELIAVIHKLLAQGAGPEAENALLKAENVAIKAQSAPMAENRSSASTMVLVGDSKPNQSDRTKTRQKKHDPEFKARVVLEAFKGVKTIQEIAKEFDLQPTQVMAWRKTIAAGMVNLFGPVRNPDGEPDDGYPVIRLESSQKHAEVVVDPSESPVRLDPEDQEGLSRTYEPGAAALSGSTSVVVPSPEERWEQQKARTWNSIPIGWVIVLCLLLAGGLFWSLYLWKKGNEEIVQNQEEVEARMEEDEKEKRAATQMIDAIHTTLKDYFSRTSVEELGPLVRHPDRVIPLMRKHYQDEPVFIGTVSSIKMLRPLDIDYRVNFWAAAAILSNGHKPLIALEVTPSGKVLIDWEALVCHQPMEWTAYAQKRPAGTTMDFRVYAEPIAFNTHEFENSKEWLCVRLTAHESIEFLFGYAKINSEAGLKLRELLKANSLGKSTMILRLTLPEGLKSPRGVLVDKVLSPGWILLDPPDSSPPTDSATPPEGSP